MLENVFKMGMLRKLSVGGASAAKADGEILMASLGWWVLMIKQQKTGAMQGESEMSVQMAPECWREYLISKWSINSS